MQKTLMILSLLGFSTSTIAALPPYYQTAKEIKAILDNSDVASKLGSGRAIDSVIRNSSFYDVTAGDCKLGVQVTYATPPQPGFAGPVQIELHVGEVNCLLEE